MNVVYIDSPSQLADWADKHKTRFNWHEPDEQGLNARVVGDHLDNAFGAHGVKYRLTDVEVDPGPDTSELRVIIEHESLDGHFVDEVAVVNLASLLAWASEPCRTAKLAYADQNARAAGS